MPKPAATAESLAANQLADRLDLLADYLQRWAGSVHDAAADTRNQTATRHGRAPYSFTMAMLSKDMQNLVHDIASLANLAAEVDVYRAIEHQPSTTA